MWGRGDCSGCGCQMVVVALDLGWGGCSGSGVGWWRLIWMWGGASYGNCSEFGGRVAVLLWMWGRVVVIALDLGAGGDGCTGSRVGWLLCMCVCAWWWLFCTWGTR